MFDLVLTRGLVLTAIMISAFIATSCKWTSNGADDGNEDKPSISFWGIFWIESSMRDYWITSKSYPRRVWGWCWIHIFALLLLDEVVFRGMQRRDSLLVWRSVTARINLTLTRFAGRIAEKRGSCQQSNVFFAPTKCFCCNLLVWI